MPSAKSASKLRTQTEQTPTGNFEAARTKQRHHKGTSTRHTARTYQTHSTHAKDPPHSLHSVLASMSFGAASMPGKRTNVARSKAHSRNTARTIAMPTRMANNSEFIPQPPGLSQRPVVPLRFCPCRFLSQRPDITPFSFSSVPALCSPCRIAGSATP